MADFYDDLCWQPSQRRIENSLLTHYLNTIKSDLPSAKNLGCYPSLHAWSVTHSEQFWQSIWQFCHVQGLKGTRTRQILDAKWQDVVENRDTTWFADSKLNYAQNLLAGEARIPKSKDNQDCETKLAMIFEREDGERTTFTWQQLSLHVSIVQQWLQAQGVTQGDVVAAYLPYGPQSVIAMLATSSIGAIWTSTSPDFGVESVIERFGQVQPKVLFCADETCFAGKHFPLLEKNEAIACALPTLTAVCVIDRDHSHPSNCRENRNKYNLIHWSEMSRHFSAKDITYTLVSFNHPLFILYSSGTTGKPKCIVHNVGGTLLNHLKEHQLHCDIQPGERVFYYTTCGWMMWNWHVSTLASGATLVIYDGSPTYPDPERLWQLAAREQVSLFGTSAKYLEYIAKIGVSPKRISQWPALKTLCSTGSVLYPEQFDYVYQQIKTDIHLASISGGTDICGCFVLGNPISPVYRGECQGAALGMDVAVFNAQAERIVDQRGELVCCNSFPNQPIGFWLDDGERYHHAYWQRFNSVWHHGDDVQATPHGGMVFYGRSDATLNPAGVRIGTGEIYRQVNTLAEIMDSLAVGYQVESDEMIVLFVQLTKGTKLDTSLRERIKTTLKIQCSPRHVPKYILPLSEMPKTKSGKLVELAVKQLLCGVKIDNLGAIANPDILKEIEQIWRSAR
ncbi:acetoacetyl-CoA synthetase [Vibrio ichthyoenteri ATCC 700023]|uniref:Acetoacetyl-CoA synthetase n=1 Tax=Vibrio ichthyoenteri ATCC 700023 TaxID=870968 RepID=F9S783_9VIBR|nr:acetoacetate--CoA ligase [Vibrio ichthyoenteri]EGU31970.1 acetoacetyl-CoA synthetase [Vibrio ichthyoenteri ATCC 700023]